MHVIFLDAGDWAQAKNIVSVHVTGQIIVLCLRMSANLVASSINISRFLIIASSLSLLEPLKGKVDGTRNLREHRTFKIKTPQRSTDDERCRNIGAN